MAVFDSEESAKPNAAQLENSDDVETGGFSAKTMDSSGFERVELTELEVCLTSFI